MKTAEAEIIVAADDRAPFWSVMVPTYNAQIDYLKAVLLSVLEQDPGSAEMHIEIVDDCSPNGAPEELVRQLGCGRIQLYRNPRNLGLAGTWNECIKRAKGQIIHILHQDDLVLPGFYERLRTGLEGNPSAGAAFCRHAFIDENGGQIGVSDLEQATAGVITDFQIRLAQKMRIQCPSMVVRKSVYSRVGEFNADFVYVLDWDMWLRISLATTIWYEPAVLACYRMHGAAVTSELQRTGRDVHDINRFLHTAAGYFPGKQGYRLTSLARLNYAKRAVCRAHIFLRAGDKRAAAVQLREAWRLHQSLLLIPGTIKFVLKVLLGHFGLLQLKPVKDC